MRDMMLSMLQEPVCDDVILHLHVKELNILHEPLR